MMTINEYIEQNKDRFLNELFELIRIPSISSQSEHKADMYRCAEKWVELMLAAGVDKAQVYETDGHPVAYGEKIIDPALKTVLIYDLSERFLEIFKKPVYSFLHFISPSTDAR
jgi:acetylornithine deacetylase/succinyl-diaminopimelate desuccinylase-like protein